MNSPSDGCPRCGGPTIALFTSRACKAECDLRPVELPARTGGLGRLLGTGVYAGQTYSVYAGAREGCPGYTAWLTPTKNIGVLGPSELLYDASGGLDSATYTAGHVAQFVATHTLLHFAQIP